MMFANVATPPTRGSSSEEKFLPNALKGAVLIIDDEEVIRLIGSEMMEYLGLSCITAANGQEGLEIFKSRVNDIGLVILDVEMPGLSGEKVFRRLREIAPQVRILIASGYSKEYLENKVFKCKIEHFIPKPFNLEHLTHQIRQFFPDEHVR